MKNVLMTKRVMIPPEVGSTILTYLIFCLMNIDDKIKSNFTYLDFTFIIYTDWRSNIFRILIFSPNLRDIKTVFLPISAHLKFPLR